MKDTQESARSTTATAKTSKVFTDEERAAIQERAREVKAWPTSFALMELTAADAARIGALVKKAVS